MNGGFDIEGIFRQIGESVSYLQNDGLPWIITMLVLGLLWCFLGYKLMRLWITLCGGLIGMALGYGICSAFSDNSIIITIAVVFGAVIVGMIAYHVYLIGVFLLCMLMGICISAVIIQPNSSAVFFLCVAIGVAIGILGVKFVQPVMIISTGMQGGMMIASAIMAISGLENNVFFGIIGMAVGIGGCVIQFLVAVHSQKRKEIAHED